MDGLSYKVRTGHELGRVVQEIEDPMGNITRRVANLAAMQMEQAIVAELISLGWTPPDSGPHKILTYKNQPGNVGAWKLGEACRHAKPGGDPIDHGLSLLKELQDRGYGVISLTGVRE